MVCGSFFRKLYTCIAFKITQPRTFLAGARRSHFNHTAHEEKSKPRETDCEAGLHMWEMMSDNGFNLPSSLWLQGSFLTDTCSNSAMFSNVNLYSLYRGWNEHLLSKVERKGICKPFLRLSNTEFFFLSLDAKNKSRTSYGWHMFQHSNSFLHTSSN